MKVVGTKTLMADRYKRFQAQRF